MLSFDVIYWLSSGWNGDRAIGTLTALMLKQKRGDNAVLLIDLNVSISMGIIHL